MTDPGVPPVLAGRYRAVELLGSGGMGVVWRAVDEMLHREVAIKEVQPAPYLGPAQRRELSERTLREARAAARLAHPGIVAVHDVISQDGRPWIVMDLVRGRSLDQVVKEDGPLPPAAAAAVGLAVLDALALAHSQGIMHRDVKPANIMIAHDGSVLLADFGIATLEGDAGITSPDNLVGSPGYIAPERLRGIEDGAAADLWSLGATLYTAVEGQAPFHRAIPVATLGAVLTQPTPEPGRAGHLGPVLLAVLEKDPQLRPGVAELREALRKVAGGLPAALPDGGPRRRGPRGRIRLIAVLAGVVVVAAAGTTFALTRAEDRPPPRPAPSAAEADAGRFTELPDPCELVTARQSRAVAPGTTPDPDRDDARFCDWGGPTEPVWLRVSLTLHRPAQGLDAPAVAQEFLLARRTKITADAGTGVWGSVRPVQDVTGVGKDSFRHDTVSLGSRAYSTIDFRSSNLLVEVQLSEKAEQPTRILRRNALETARAVAEELNSRD
ncbi:serine/threonine-protein kinase [Streptosporangium sp. KLBMP 9127]|nr:serine/threonine protein kinase [Streptosporangium sp. KLBMP 9127]